MDKKILISSLLSSILLPAMALAATIEGMVDAAVRTTLYIGGGIVVILWVVTGILFLTAQGDPSKTSSAKKALLAAIAGTVLIIVASGAVSLVSNAFGL